MTEQARWGLQKSPLYEQVADLLEREIMSEHREGVRLPSEQALAERFDVSRTIVREAMKLLKERGLIDSRTGSGAFSTKPEAHNLSDVMARIIRLDGIGVADIYEVRTILEVASVRGAAQRATPLQLREMAQRLDALKDKTITVTQRQNLDFEFHYLIAQAGGNALLVVLVEAMTDIFKDIIKSGIFVSGGIDDGIARHAKIYDELCTRDPDAAEKAMREHLDQSLINALNYRSSLKQNPDTISAASSASISPSL